MCRCINRVLLLFLFQTEFCLSACSMGIVCLWEYKTAHIIHELDCRASDDGIDKKDETSFGIVKACCNSNHIIALLRDNKVQIWNRSDGYLSNIIEMVCILVLNDYWSCDHWSCDHWSCDHRSCVLLLCVSLSLGYVCT